MQQSTLQQAVTIIKDTLTTYVSYVEGKQAPSVKTEADSSKSSDIQTVLSDVAKRDLKEIVKSLISLASVKEGKIVDDAFEIHSLSKLDAYSKLKKFFS